VVAVTDMLPMLRGMSVAVKNAGVKDLFLIASLVMAAQQNVLPITRRATQRNIERITWLEVQSNQENFLKFPQQFVKIAVHKHRFTTMRIIQSLWKLMRFVRFAT